MWRALNRFTLETLKKDTPDSGIAKLINYLVLRGVSIGYQPLTDIKNELTALRFDDTLISQLIADIKSAKSIGAQRFESNFFIIDVKSRKALPADYLSMNGSSD